MTRLSRCLMVLLGVTATPSAGLMAQSTDTVTVFAAADLAHAFEQIAPMFERRTGVAVTLVFGASAGLALQIERGAPADVFFAANVGYVDRLIEGGVLVPGTKTIYARGRLVLAWPKYGAALFRLDDLLRPEVRRVAIANPEVAPYGLAAKQALEASGLWARLEPKLVIAENVRQALQYLQTGAVEAGLVGPSVVQVSEVNHLLVDARLHHPIDQAAGIGTRSRRAREAAEFLAFITGPEGWPVMAENGFTRPPVR